MGRNLELITASILSAFMFGCASIPEEPVKNTSLNCVTCDFPTNEVKSGRVIYGFCKVHNRYLPKGFIDCDKPNDLIVITYFRYCKIKYL